MITTLPPTEEAARTATASSSAAVPTGSRGLAVPATPDHPWLPYALGALIGLLIVLILAAWGYLALSDADFTGIVDLSRAVQP
ncbi:MAG TPA: hypothetical protein VLQ92_02675 [Candidatus Limnocylindrales bacterium]|nr:hypothetical protein [Candidatus Limnocylindrales bacterium]